jgi:GntR family transcriptional repressor for pyruvate dehydrogenase complex
MDSTLNRAFDPAPILREAVSDLVFGQLVDAILSGTIGAEEALPSERDLAENFQVNRHAIREALKRLQQAGLVRISQGGKTRALDWRQHAGLDVLSLLASTGSIPAARVLHDILVMRRSIGSDAAALCALRGTDEQLATVQTAAAAYDGFEGDLAFWTAVVDGSDNLAYRLGLNTLVTAFNDLGIDVVADLGLASELVDPSAHQDLARAIAARDADTARTLAHDLLSRIVDSTSPKD